MLEPILVFDLDGTILHGNSYHSWVRHLLFGPFSHLSTVDRLRLRFQTIRFLASRKLLRWRHARVKAVLRGVWAEAVRSDPKELDTEFLIGRLQTDIRPWFQPVLARVAAGEVDAIVATAAAGEYAVPFARQLGFREILATTSPHALCEENLGPAKAQAVAERLQALGWAGRPILLFTDHRDDLPLIRMSAGLVWFGAPGEVSAISETLPGLRSFSPESVSSAEFLARLDSKALV